MDRESLCPHDRIPRSGKAVGAEPDPRSPYCRLAITPRLWRVGSVVMGVLVLAVEQTVFRTTHPHKRILGLGVEYVIPENHGVDDALLLHFPVYGAFGLLRRKLTA